MLLIGYLGMAQKKGYRGFSDMKPDQIATLQTKKMTLALDLTEAQQKAIHKLFVANAEFRKSKKEARTLKKEEGERTRLTSEERYALANERLDRAIATKTDMKKILSPEQYEKWEKMQHHKIKRAKGKKRSKGRKHRERR